MGRFLVAVLSMLALIGCQNQTQAVLSPVPSPSPHAAPTDAILQSADVPAGLAVCMGSGPIDVYVTVLARSDPALAARIDDAWQQMRADGADAGAISVFAADPSACAAELGATAKVKAVASFVARFGDAGQAHRAWLAGIFGFQPPPAGEVAPGVTVGPATGLGANAFIYGRPSVILATWQRTIFVALVVASNLDQATFHNAAVAVDPRLN